MTPAKRSGTQARIGHRSPLLAAHGYRPFASTLAAFRTRAHDFIRMAAVSGADLRHVGSHAAVGIGADGRLEDIAMMRAVHDWTVL